MPRPGVSPSGSDSVRGPAPARRSARDQPPTAEAEPGGGAVRFDLLLPHGEVGLDRLDQRAAHFERRGPVGGGDRDHHGGIADL
jgi:hypothetical protein